MSEQKNISNDLTRHWIIVGILLSMLIVYNVVCQLLGAEIQINIGQEQRVFIRTILYIVTILLFPLTNLLRHILLRLNQTMPGHKSARSRYFITTTTTLSVIEIVGFFGLVMFILGDSYNTLYIFTTLATLGVFLHRPKEIEYQQIIDSLKSQEINNR